MQQSRRARREETAAVFISRWVDFFHFYCPFFRRALFQYCREVQGKLTLSRGTDRSKKTVLRKKLIFLSKQIGLRQGPHGWKGNSLLYKFTTWVFGLSSKLKELFKENLQITSKLGPTFERDPKPPPQFTSTFADRYTQRRWNIVHYVLLTLFT